MGELNDSQREVVESDSSKIVCVAGAGTGKTFTLIEKLKYLVTEKGVDPTSIMVLTFTRAAAGEFESRYRLAVKTGASPYFGTFHAFCYALTREDMGIRGKLGYKTDNSFPLTVIDGAIEESIKKEAMLTASVNLPQKALKYDYVPTLKEKMPVKMYRKALKKLLVEKDFITFDILCYEVCKLFENRDPLIINYLSKYRYIFIDEFQDTDKHQWEFVRAFEELSNIMVVGDIRQSIYQFRGADSSIMKSLMENPEWETLYLENNYRSTKQVCEYANDILDTYKDGIQSAYLHSDKEGVAVEEIKGDQFKALYENRDIDKQKHGKSIAVLARTNNTVNMLRHEFKSAGIWTAKQSGKEVSAYMAAIDEKFLIPYLMSKLTVPEVAHMAQYKLIDGDKFDDYKYLKDKFPNEVGKITSIQNSDNFGELRAMYLNGDLNIEDIEADIQSTHPSIYIGTIHSVKGLEFDEVYVYGPNSREFKLDSEEAKNLFYVACTRAKDKLVVVEDVQLSKAGFVKNGPRW